MTYPRDRRRLQRSSSYGFRFTLAPGDFLFHLCFLSAFNQYYPNDDISFKERHHLI